MPRRLSTQTKLVLAILLAALVIGGCAASDGLDNLVRRARTEINGLLPKPDFVPTPLAAVPFLPTYTPTTIPARRTTPIPETPPTATPIPAHQPAGHPPASPASPTCGRPGTTADPPPWP